MKDISQATYDECFEDMKSMNAPASLMVGADRDFGKAVSLKVQS